MTYSLPFVSICCITYNHEKFIKDALDGFLMQQINFPIEILIHDDASTDETANIIKDYENKYPDIIRPIYQRENQYSKGIKPNVSFNFPRTQGKYIALCEGDDYWTDPLKLQKQVDFLEANPDFAICFHNAVVINENFPEKNRLNNDDSTPEISTLDDLLKGVNYITTASVVIRTNLIQKLPDWFTSLPFGDYALYLIAAHHSKIRYINEIMSVYRIHQGGIHGHLGNSIKGLTKAYQQHYEFWKIIDKSGMISSSKLNQAILKAIENVIENAAKSKQTQVFVTYSYLLLMHSRGRNWRKLATEILGFCRRER
jgi:glycosyltransferase involved in cell wall biosynthesis